ncbi:uncharacterized protein LOC143186263 [Calliopsis andreniformis]|uniref:uncharacterized protein LOC143186263 n=1 Tax=Calliopsis andreniformis TaxID=337506 RepID=UPI003FCECD9E
MHGGGARCRRTGQKGRRNVARKTASSESVEVGGDARAWIRLDSSARVEARSRAADHRVGVAMLSLVGEILASRVGVAVQGKSRSAGARGLPERQGSESRARAESTLEASSRRAPRRGFLLCSSLRVPLVHACHSHAGDPATRYSVDVDVDWCVLSLSTGRPRRKFDSDRLQKPRDHGRVHGGRRSARFEDAFDGESWMKVRSSGEVTSRGKV